MLPLLLRRIKQKLLKKFRSFFITFAEIKLMKKITILIAFFAISSCSSNDDQKQLPLTMNGSNSVEYTFNGEKISSFDSDEDAKEIQCGFTITNTWIYIKLGKNDVYSTLTISVNTLLEEGKTYQIKGSLNSNVRAFNEYYGPNIQYINCGTNNEVGGTITITKLDYTNRIIAANFSYDCADDKGTVYTVRDGWFDL